MSDVLQRFNVAYFTHECQLFSDIIRTSSGGLGVVSRDDLYGFEQLGFPAVGITLGPTHGYGKQIIRNDKEMDIVYPANPTHKREVLGFCSMWLSGREVKIEVADVNDIERKYTRLLQLSTDVEGNPEDIRHITRVLYGGVHSTGAFFPSKWEEDKWLKVCQQAVLGIGGLMAMRLLGIEADLNHMNESHGAFAQLFIYQEYLRQGYSPAVAREKTVRRFVYTNHTPVEAGNPVHPYDLTVDVLKAHIDKETYAQISGTTDCVPMTEIAFALSRKSNGVADLHAKVIRDMYHRPEILGIRNGIYVPEWQLEEFRRIDKPSDIPKVKAYYKEVVFKECLRRARECGFTGNDKISLDEFLAAYPTLSFARRWAGYKRMRLITNESERAFFENYLKWGKMSLIWGGSPHADDTEQRKNWEEMLAYVRKFPNVLTFLNYDPWGMKYLKASADIWFNFMWYLHEACGTSWMSGLLNCALNVTILDGGTGEAKDWVISYGSTEAGGWEDQYAYDAQDLWKKLSTEILPKFWSRDPSLYAFLFEAKQWAEENLSFVPTCERYIKELYEMEI